MGVSVVGRREKVSEETLSRLEALDDDDDEDEDDDDEDGRQDKRVRVFISVFIINYSIFLLITVLL